MAAAWREGEHRVAEELRQPNDPWQDPDLTLLEDRRGDLPTFPIEVLPAAWQPWLGRAARGAGGNPDHVAIPLLAIVSGLIGAARRVRPSRSWSEPICLWTWLRATGRTIVSREDVRRDALSQRFDAEATDNLLETLVTAGWLRMRAQPKQGAGRPAYRWEDEQSSVPVS